MLHLLLTSTQFDDAAMAGVSGFASTREDTQKKLRGVFRANFLLLFRCGESAAGSMMVPSTVRAEEAAAQLRIELSFLALSFLAEKGAGELSGNSRLLLRTGTTPIVCFVGVTANPVSRCVANRNRKKWLEIRGERSGTRWRAASDPSAALREGERREKTEKTWEGKRTITFGPARGKESSAEARIWRGEVRNLSRGAIANHHPELHFIIRVKSPFVWTFESARSNFATGVFSG
jgi:hypothetical protein